MPSLAANSGRTEMRWQPGDPLSPNALMQQLTIE